VVDGSLEMSALDSSPIRVVELPERGARREAAVGDLDSQPEPLAQLLEPRAV